MHQFAGQRTARAARRDFSEQLAELARRRHGRALPDVGRQPPPRAPARRARQRSSTRAAIASTASSISRRSKPASNILEGTGSLVLDRERHVAYACRSPRTHADALAEFARALDYEIVPFDGRRRRRARDLSHQRVMSLGTRFAALCTRAIADPAERRTVVARLEGSGRELIDLKRRGARRASPATCWSSRAARGRSSRCRLRHCTRSPHRRGARLERYGELVPADIATIERIGGGSVRCMLAEVPLPLAG